MRKKFSKEIDECALVVQHKDVLEQFKQGSLCDEPYDLVANLPYYIATAIILEALEDPQCKSMLVMIQKEVAQKFAAEPKSKEFTALAILAQSLGHVTLLFDVDPTSFDPQPKVVSSILRIDKQQEFVKGIYTGIFETKEEFESFKKYLRHSFQNPRKTWMKNISSEFSKALIEQAMLEYSLFATIRPHELSVLSHHLLFKYLRLHDAKQRKQQEP